MKPRNPGRSSSSWPMGYFTKWRRDHTILLTLFAVAMFFALRVSQLRQSSRDASTIRTVLTTTQGEPFALSMCIRSVCHAQILRSSCMRLFTTARTGPLTPL